MGVGRREKDGAKNFIVWMLFDFRLFWGQIKTKLNRSKLSLL